MSSNRPGRQMIRQRAAVEFLLRAMRQTTTREMRLYWLEALSWTLDDNGTELFEMRRGWIASFDEDFLDLALMQWSGPVTPYPEVASLILSPLLEVPRHEELATERLAEALRFGSWAENSEPKPPGGQMPKIDASSLDDRPMTLGAAVETLLDQLAPSPDPFAAKLNLISELAWLMADSEKLLEVRRAWLRGNDYGLVDLALGPWGAAVSTDAELALEILGRFTSDEDRRPIAAERLVEAASALDEGQMIMNKRPPRGEAYPWNRTR